MTTDNFRLNALVSLLLRRGYYPVAPECAGEGAQLKNGQWHMPMYGCDTLQHVIDEHGDEMANTDDATPANDLRPAPYGYCPICCKPGECRERRPNGNDCCEAGHVYPSSSALTEPLPICPICGRPNAK